MTHDTLPTGQDDDSEGAGASWDFYVAGPTDQFAEVLGERFWRAAAGDAAQQFALAELVANYHTILSEEGRAHVRSASLVAAEAFPTREDKSLVIEVNVDWAQFARRIELFSTSRPRDVASRLNRLVERHWRAGESRAAVVILALLADSGPIAWEDNWTEAHQRYGDVALSACVEGVLRRGAGPTLRWIEREVTRSESRRRVLTTTLPRLCRDEPQVVARFLANAPNEFSRDMKWVDENFGPFLGSIGATVDPDVATLAISEIKDVTLRAKRAATVEDSVRLMADVEDIANRVDPHLAEQFVI